MDAWEGSSNDPISLHKYLYANGNPVGNVDPSGESAISELVKVALITLTLSGVVLNASGFVNNVNGFASAKTFEERAQFIAGVFANVAGLILALIPCGGFFSGLAVSSVSLGQSLIINAAASNSVQITSLAISNAISFGSISLIVANSSGKSLTSSSTGLGS